MINISSAKMQESTRRFEPYILKEGGYGETFEKNGEPLFLRMELITRANLANWDQYKAASQRMANRHTSGLLGRLVETVGTEDHLACQSPLPKGRSLKGN